MYKIIFFLFVSISLQGQSVYKTPHGEKYHAAGCRMVKNVSEELSLNEAVAEGLEPCKICKPAFKAALIAPAPHKAKGQAKTTYQCSGITKAGTRCKHRTSIANGYCFQHDPDK